MDKFISRQLATLVHIDLALNGHNEDAAQSSAEQQPNHPPNSLEVFAKERLAQPLPGARSPRHGVKRCPLHAASFVRLIRSIPRPGGDHTWSEYVVMSASPRATRKSPGEVTACSHDRVLFYSVV